VYIIEKMGAVKAMRILLVEDEKYIAEAVAKVLKKNGYAVELAYDGEYGLDCALSGVFDAIVLDIMLPKLDGLTALEKMRAGGIEAPVILLTAKGELGDKVKGFHLGADDYLPKPFHTEELLVRIEALMRRRPTIKRSDIFIFADVELILSALTLRVGDAETPLQLKDAQIFELLIENDGGIVSKETIIEKVWGYDAETEYNQVEKHISYLRKTLTRLKASVSIQTIRGVGYALKNGGGTDVK
jgi:DNA-binding response OmpR family regulator